MRKLLIFSPFFPPHIGGVETHVYEFSKHLSEKDFYITIFTPNLPKTKEKEKIKENLQVVRYPAVEIFGNPLPKFWTLKFWKLLKKATRNKPDYVMSRTRFFFPSLFSFLYSKLTRKKHIHVEHGSDYLDLGSKWKNSLTKLYDLIIGKLILSRSDICVVISQASYKFVKKFRKKKIYLITRGMEIKEIEKTKLDKTISENYKNKTKICFCGRLIYWKGLHNALKAFSNLPKKLQEDSVFLVIGDGPEKKKYENKYKNPKINFLGKLPRKKALSILKSSDIFIHSTISGGALSSSLLEAMCLGKAIIASPAEGADEVIFNNKTGLLLRESSPKEFEKVFQKLIKDKKLQTKLGKEAKKYLKENFKWDEKIEEYLKLFGEITNY